MRFAKSNIFTLLFSVMTVGGFPLDSIHAADYSRQGTGNWSDAAWTVNGSPNQNWADGNSAVISAANENELNLDTEVSLTALTFSGLTDSDSAALNGTQTLTFTGDSAFFNVANGTLTTSAALNGAFTKTGAGTLTLTAIKTSTTPIRVQEGTLRVAAGEFGNQGLKNTAVSLAPNTRLEITQNFGVGGGMITADGAVIHITGEQNYLNQLTLKNGARVTAQNGWAGNRDHNSYRVGYSYGGVNAPILNVEGTSASFVDAGITMVRGGSGWYTVNVASTGDASGVDLTINGTIYDYPGEVGAALKKNGEGTLKLTSNENSWVTGFAIEAGKVILAANNAGGKGHVTTADGTAIVLTEGISASLKSLSGAAAVSAEGSGATLILGSGITDASHSATFTGTISSNITLVKDGAGTAEFTRTPGQIGGLTVNAGTFTIAGEAGYGDQGFGSAPILVNDGAKLKLSAEFAIKGSSVTLDGGAIEITVSQIYLNDLTLKNGAVISAKSNSTHNADGNSFRVGNNYGTGKNPVTIVSGSAASAIAADIVLTAHGSSQWNLTVNDTGDTSGADLIISGQLRDYAYETGQAIPFVKTGAGTLRLSNAANSWTRGATISEGTLQLAGTQAAGFGNINLNGTATALDLLAADAGGAGTYELKSISGDGKVTASAGNAKLILGEVTAANGTVHQSGDTEFKAQITAGVSVEKVGSGTLTFNRSKGNETAFDGLLISEGTVVLQSNGGGLTASGTYGNLGATPITVTNSGKLLIAESWNLQGTPLNVIGEDAGFELQRSNYANRVTLTDGADVFGNEYRVGYTTFAPTLNVTGNGSGSEISVSTFMLVRNEKAMDLNYAVLNIQDTGAANSGNPDLRISSRIKDHDGLEGMVMRKTGAGSLELTNSENSWNGGIDLQEGALWFTNGALGNGTLNAAAGTTVGAVPSASETFTLIPAEGLADGANVGILIDSSDEFSRFTLSELPSSANDGFLKIILGPDAFVSTSDSFKISNAIPADSAENLSSVNDLDLENWLLPDFRNDWNLNWLAAQNALILNLDANAVPEPSAFLLLILGSLGIWRLRASRKQK